MKQQKETARSSKTRAVGEGRFYHIEIRSQQGFKTFHAQKFGIEDGIERVGGQRADGSWETVKWLVSKELAHVENGRLIADDKEARTLFDKLNFVPKHIEGDRFAAQVRIFPSKK